MVLVCIFLISNHLLKIIGTGMEIVFRVTLNPITCIFHLFTLQTSADCSPMCRDSASPPTVNRWPCAHGAQLLKSHCSGAWSPDVSHLCLGQALRRDLSASALRGWQYRICLALLTSTAALATSGCGTPEMWLVQIELCGKCKLGTRFQRLTGKKYIKHPNF